ncbi:MAG: 16S rRNA (cytosine(967)-C(5))-methyltransferase [Cyanobium sp.]
MPKPAPPKPAASSPPADAPARPSGPSGLAPRAAAWQVLLAVAAGAYADAALERQLARDPLSSADRALATELAYGAIRQRRLLDAWLSALGRVPAERQPPKLRWLLHVGLYQLLFSTRIPAAAAVNTSVELARTIGLERLAPVVNGLLRAVLRRRQDAGPEPWAGLELPGEAAASLALRHSLPDWLTARLLEWLPPAQAEAFARTCNNPPPLDLRVQPLRCDRAALLEALAAAGVSADALPGCPQGLTLRERPGDLRALPGYAEGWWSVQDRNAQRIVPLLDPRPGQRVLDVCAAPGGKTTQIAELLQGQGELWAVDRSEARLKRVAINARRLGVEEGLQRLAADGTSLAELRPDWIGRMDRILVDAPCSGLGTLARHADARWRLQPEAIDALVALQAALLDGVLPLLAPAGRLLYATCTVHPRENSLQIRDLLQRHPGLQLLQEHQWWPGMTGNGEPLAATEDSGDGFYAALLERLPVREAAAAA